MSKAILVLIIILITIYAGTIASIQVLDTYHKQAKERSALEGFSNITNRAKYSREFYSCLDRTVKQLISADACETYAREMSR